MLMSMAKHGWKKFQEKSKENKMAWTTYDPSAVITSDWVNGNLFWDNVEKTVEQCEYCGSRIDDMRGNCGACGAPKGKPYNKQEGLS